MSRARLRSDLATWHPPEFDAPALDDATWGWLNYLHGRLRHGEAWMVRYGVMDTLNNRVLPLLGRRTILPTTTWIRPTSTASTGQHPPRRSPRNCAVPCGQQQSCTPGRSTDGRSAPGSRCREARSPQ